MKHYRKALFIAALIVLVVAGTTGWMYLSSYESTDDAQVDGHLHPISARISGTVLQRESRRAGQPFCSGGHCSCRD